jgi:hypothetical protein
MQQVKLQAQRIKIANATVAGTYEFTFTLDNNYDSCSGFSVALTNVTDSFRYSIRDEHDMFVDKVPHFLFSPGTSVNIKKKIVPINIRGKGNKIVIMVYLPSNATADNFIDFIFRMEKKKFSGYAERIKYQAITRNIPIGSTSQNYEKYDTLDQQYKKVTGIAVCDFIHTVTTDLYQLSVRDAADAYIQPLDSAFLAVSTAQNIDDRFWPVLMKAGGNIATCVIKPDAVTAGIGEFDFIFRLENN